MRTYLYTLHIYTIYIYAYVPYIELMHDTEKALLDHRNGSFEVCPVYHFFRPSSSELLSWLTTR